MKEKSQIEKKAEEKQITLLSTALSEASNAGGHWLNASGKGYPRLYPKGVSVSAFNALFMTLHSDKNGCKTNQFTLFSDAKAQVKVRIPASRLLNWRSIPMTAPKRKLINNFTVAV